MATNVTATGYSTTFAGASLSTVGEIKSLSIDGMEVGEVEISSMDSASGWIEKIPSMKNAGDLSIELYYYETRFTALMTALSTSQEFTVTFPDSSTFIFTGFCKNLSLTDDHQEAIEVSASFAISGIPVFTEV